MQNHILSILRDEEIYKAQAFLSVNIYPKIKDVYEYIKIWRVMGMQLNRKVVMGTEYKLHKYGK